MKNTHRVSQESRKASVTRSKVCLGDTGFSVTARRGSLDETAGGEMTKARSGCGGGRDSPRWSHRRICLRRSPPETVVLISLRGYGLATDRVHILTKKKSKIQKFFSIFSRLVGPYISLFWYTKCVAIKIQLSLKILRGYGLVLR